MHLSLLPGETERNKSSARNIRILAGILGFIILFNLTERTVFASNPSKKSSHSYFRKLYSRTVYQKKPANAKVWDVKYVGNETFSGIVLSDITATESPSLWKKMKFWNRSGFDYSETEVKKDVIRIKHFYERRGFPDVKVDYEAKEGNRSWKKKVIFKITEHQPIIIKNLTYSCQADSATKSYILESIDFNKTKKKLPYQPGKRYATINQPDVKGGLINTMKNLGFAYARVTIAAQVDSAFKQADLNITLEPGPKTYIDSVEVTGRYNVSENFVIRQSGLKKGQLFSAKKLQDSQRELFNHPLFRFATIGVPKQPHDSSIVLQVRVRENALHTISGKVGFGRDEYARGEVTWTNRNIWNLGHQFTTSARASFIEQRLSMDYLLPYIFNNKSSIVINPFGQHLLEPSYELFRYGFNNSFVYQYTRSTTGSISYELTRNRELTQNTFSNLPDSVRKYNISAIQLSGYYGQGFLGNQVGWVVQPYAEFSGLLGSAAFKFEKLSLDVRRYFQLNKSLKLAGRVQGGTIFYTQSDSLPSNIRFYAGGTNTVRGWSRQSLGPKRVILDENGNFKRYVPTGGHVLFNFNVELRQQLDFFINGLGLAVFLDGGQVWSDIKDTGNRPIQYGAGGGFRYQSPIGPVRVDIGYKLNPTDQDLDIYQGQDYGGPINHFAIHFSVGQAF